MKNVFIALAAAAMMVTACGDAKVKSKPVTAASEKVETVKENKSKRPEGVSEFYTFKMNDIDGNTIDFAEFKGQKVLLVNVASKCGYTPQYEGLQKLQEKYGDKVTILGFPANNFGGQEPGSNKDIKSFCTGNYGVTFQMFEKISVKGDDQHPLYQWLSMKDKNGWNDQEPNWNFNKYLVNENGELVKYFGSKVKPMSEELVAAIVE
ncbi:glutathione peroxidase [Persicobacter sp. CCB-QB2]|uniref:glutathione peroxidase n=1 Tax=Persicobacter sp. CCB-QB2 TaxID=1561025 RepID=UPI0006A9E35C|nr:glutathione peroxidase [Persicobacter sp. CCB-QB2]